MAGVDPLNAYDEIAKWERVWVEVVALAWKDSTFKGKLLAEGGKHARTVIKDEFHFQLATDVQLNVVEADKATEWDKATLMWKHPRAVSTLTLTLPKAPPKTEDQAVALSHYLASGQSMPFTCCC